MCFILMQSHRPSAQRLKTPVISISKEIKHITTKALRGMKSDGERRYRMLTIYDFRFAKSFDGTGIEVILVGILCPNLMADYETTLPITLDQMIYRASSMITDISRSLAVIDIPLSWYLGNSKEAMISTVRIYEGASRSVLQSFELAAGEILESVTRILAALGIPVSRPPGTNTTIHLPKFWHLYRTLARDGAEAK